MSRALRTLWISCNESITLLNRFVKSEECRMDTSFAERLKKRAETMLPPATMMKIECAADGGDKTMEALLEETQRKGLQGEALCREPCRAVIFADRVLLRCEGCSREKKLPRIGGIGYGHTEEEARENALYALTLPLDHPNARLSGCMAAMTWGEGPVKDVQYACILNRVAYAEYPERII